MKHLVSFLSGLLFGLGLILTGMYSPDVIISGLKIGASTFSWALYITFATAFFTTFIIFQIRRWLSTPLSQDCYKLPTVHEINWQLVLGAFLFGIGWGLSGICPGPNVVGLGIITYPFYWINFAGIIMGFIGARQFIKTMEK